MTFDQARTQLSRNRVYLQYALVGPERFQKEQFVRLLEEAFAPHDLDKDYCESESDALQCLNSLPIGSTKRFVVVREFEKFGRLRQYMLSPNPRCVAIFVSSPDYKAADFIPNMQKQPSLCYVKCYPLQGEKLERWIEAKVAEHGSVILAPAVRRLMELLGNNLYRLELELRKLSAVQKQITLQDVDFYVSTITHQEVFNLVEALVSRDKKATARVLADVDIATVTGALITTLAMRYLDLYQINEMRDRGIRGFEMAQILQVPAYFLGSMAAQSKLYVNEEIEALLVRLYEVDLQVRRGNLLALDMLLSEILNQKIQFERRKSPQRR